VSPSFSRPPRPRGMRKEPSRANVPVRLPGAYSFVRPTPREPTRCTKTVSSAARRQSLTRRLTKGTVVACSSQKSAGAIGADCDARPENRGPAVEIRLRTLDIGKALSAESVPRESDPMEVKRSRISHYTGGEVVVISRAPLTGKVELEVAGEEPVDLKLD